MSKFNQSPSSQRMKRRCPVCVSWIIQAVLTSLVQRILDILKRTYLIFILVVAEAVQTRNTKIVYKEKRFRAILGQYSNFFPERPFKTISMCVKPIKRIHCNYVWIFQQPLQKLVRGFIVYPDIWIFGDIPSGMPICDLVRFTGKAENIRICSSDIRKCRPNICSRLNKILTLSDNRIYQLK